MNSVERFSNRVENYVKYRPSYPVEVIDLISSRFGLPDGSTVGDIGSGTGIFSALLLDAGFEVIAVEPNEGMRAAAEGWLSSRPLFGSVDATAEATTLPDRSLDLIVATQAFHWFDPAAFRLECLRLLRGSAPVALIWNERSDKDSAFSVAYESLIAEYCSDYKETRHRNFSTEKLADFFAPAEMTVDVFANEQRLDWDGFKGRLLSSSYAPVEGHEFHEPMMDRLRELFDEFNEDGLITLRYDCRVYSGQLNSRA